MNARAQCPNSLSPDALDEVEINIDIDKTDKEKKESGTTVSINSKSNSGILPVKEKCGPIEKIYMDTQMINIIGEPWVTVKLMQKAKEFLFTLHDKLNQRNWLVSLYSLYTAAVVASIVLCVLSLRELYDGRNAVLITLLLSFGMLLQIITLSTIVYVLVEKFRGRVFEVKFLICAEGLKVLNCLLGILCALGILNDSCVYGGPLIGSSCVSCILSILLILAAAIFSIILFFLIIAEFCVRVWLHKLKCPEKHRVILEFAYQKYRFNATCFGASKCAVCLGELTADDEVVQLACHSSHVFHESCILGWMNQAQGCPVCRRGIAFVYSCRHPRACFNINILLLT
eukprot:TRINITY_DN2971_c0_g2_i3.p1 TRINITY_DN2971_c0_g2~~TRINITY_DN2971_c0_g2_i3.p1  ORF type:complete len:343 (+),score=43.78 TRINITY_DN2971_c0_g2_i3:48-1076(+)